MEQFSKQSMLLACLALAAAGAAQAPADEVFTVDGVHSSIMFRVKHMDVAYFYGRFNQVEGQFTIVEEDLAKSNIEVIVQVESIDTNSKKRDDHLKSPDFFNAKQYPLITFKSTKVEKAEDGKFKVTGNLTLCNKVKPLEIIIEKTGEAADPWGGYRYGLETAFTIKRSEFGVNGYLGKGVGDEVRLMVSLEGVRKK